MAGIVFIVIVLLMLIACVAIFLGGQGIMFIDPQPSYYIIEDEEEPTPRRAFYYPPKDHGPIYQEMVDRLGSLR